MMDPDQDVFIFQIRKPMTLREFAGLMDVSLRHVNALVQTGRLDAINVGLGSERRSLRITEEAVQKYVADAAVATAPATHPRPRRLLRRIATPPEIGDDGYAARRELRRKKKERS